MRTAEIDLMKALKQSLAPDADRRESHQPPMTLERVMNAMRIAQLLEPDAPRNMADALRRHAVADVLHAYELGTAHSGPLVAQRLPWAEC